MSEDQNYGYILRLSTEDWRDQVYELKKYYSGVCGAGNGRPPFSSP